MELELESYTAPRMVTLPGTTQHRFIHLSDDGERSLCGLHPDEGFSEPSDLWVCGNCREITKLGHAMKLRFCQKCEHAEQADPRLKRVVGK